VLVLGFVGVGVVRLDLICFGYVVVVKDCWLDVADLFQLVFGGDGVGLERDRLEMRGVLAVTEERADLSATIWWV
jgi:hypothetical protein